MSLACRWEPSPGCNHTECTTNICRRTFKETVHQSLSLVRCQKVLIFVYEDVIAKVD